MGKVRSVEYDGGIKTKYIQEDQAIEMLTDGGSTGAKKLNVTFVIRR